MFINSGISIVGRSLAVVLLRIFQADPGENAVCTAPWPRCVSQVESRQPRRLPIPCEGAIRRTADGYHAALGSFSYSPSDQIDQKASVFLICILIISRSCFARQNRKNRWYRVVPRRFLWKMSRMGAVQSLLAQVCRANGCLFLIKQMSRLRFKNATASDGYLSNWAGESAGAECRRYRRPLLGLDSFAWWRVQLPKFSWYRTFRKTAKSMTSLCLTLDVGGWGNFEIFILKVETFLKLASGNYMELIISINSPQYRQNSLKKSATDLAKTS